MQIAPILIIVAVSIVTFLIRFITLLLAIFFAGRIMGGKIVTLRDAFIGTALVVIVQEVVWWILFFLLPDFADIAAIVFGILTLILVIIKFYDFGCFGSIALVMLTVVMFSAVGVMSIVLNNILFLPPP
jgi:hypothetical protein